MTARKRWPVPDAGLGDQAEPAGSHDRFRAIGRAKLAEQASGWVKPLVALAGGVINGGSEADIDTIMAG